MTDSFPLAKQRLALLAFRDSLGARETALRRDEGGDWAIFGQFGHVYATPEGFLIYDRGAPEFSVPSSAKTWEAAKRTLSFCKVILDGDAEGLLSLDRLPSESEAQTIRERLRIPKKRAVTEAELARLGDMSPFIARRSHVVDRFIVEKTASGQTDGGRAAAPAPGE
jgi:hypothetical protein